MREINNKYDGAATEARAAIDGIQSSIAFATRTSKEATENLTRTLIHVHWTTILLGALAIFLIGCLVGISFR
jgi:ElaB/YqjD/DUF883 family membrane-anchored ribosome-binding protein